MLVKGKFSQTAAEVELKPVVSDHHRLLRIGSLSYGGLASVKGKYDQCVVGIAVGELKYDGWLGEQLDIK